jgi:type IV pilus assembly protein PilC
MAMLLDVGLPPLQTLVLLQRGANSPSLNTAIEKIVDAVNNGRPMSHGMRHSPQVFDEVYVHLVSTGELNGQLPKTLSQLAVDLERKIKLKRDVRSALIYPSCVVTTAALTSSLLLVFVIPTFKDLFADFGVALPWLTQKVIALSELSVRWLPGTLGTLCVLFAVLARLMSTTRGRDSFDSVSLTCPLVGKLLVQSSLARVARTLSTTLEAGVPILPALQASGHAADNSSIRRDIEEARLKVAEGVPLSQALTRSKLISPTMIQMLEVGERTGSLDKMLGKIAHYYEDEVERAVTNLKHLIEPVIMVVLGTVVGGIVLAMYLPIFNMGALVR